VRGFQTLPARIVVKGKIALKNTDKSFVAWGNRHMIEYVDLPRALRMRIRVALKFRDSIPFVRKFGENLRRRDFHMRYIKTCVN